MSQPRIALYLAVVGAIGLATSDATSGDTKARLSELADMILFESYADQNWDIYRIHPDGTGRVNLTQTPEAHELYPQASADGRQICFLVDEPAGRNTSRSLWLMNADGSNRRRIADGARHACWSPDGKRIAFAKQEFPRFNVKDYVTKYLYIYDVERDETSVHPNDKIEHIYVPTWSADGKWIIATVHGGMGYGHAIVGIEVDGNRIVDLKIPGCRPTLSADGKRLTWSSNDHTVNVADVNYTDAGPVIENSRIVYHHDTMHLYHPDFSPDGKYLTFSYGPGGRVPAQGPGTHVEVAEMVGVCGVWDIYIKAIDEPGEPVRVTQSPQLSNKESEWIRSN